MFSLVAGFTAMAIHRLVKGETIFTCVPLAIHKMYSERFRSHLMICMAKFQILFVYQVFSVQSLLKVFDVKTSLYITVFSASPSLTGTL